MRRIKMCAFIVSLLMFVSVQAFCAWEFRNQGVRPAGMAGAFIGLSDDVSALTYNPAGITSIDRISLSLAYARPLVGLDEGKLEDMFVGGVIPLPENWGHLGFHFLNFSFRGPNPVTSEEKILYGDMAVSAAYAHKVGNKLTLAGDIRYLSFNIGETGYSSINPFFEEGYNADGVSFGTGLMWTPGAKLSLGIRAENLLRTDISLGGGDKLPTEVGCGIGYKPSKHLNLAFDIEYILEKSFNIDFGCEGWFLHKILGVRAGYSFVLDKKFREIIGQNLACGLSVRPKTPKIKNLQIDYAFIFPFSGISTYGTHRLGITFWLEALPWKK